MEKKIAKPVVLVDGSSYLYRAYHAMPSLTNSKGKPTGAVYGVVNMLLKLIRDYEPEHMVVIFDAKGKTFREAIFPQYKAHRPPMPPELVVQIEPIHLIVRALGLPLIIHPGVEADDVIGTLAKKIKTLGLTTIISTGDKDLAQLVDENISLINTMTNTLFTPESVREKFGITPEQIVDYLALIGDTVDNIPGVPQVGPKTAVKWLLEHGSLDGIIMNADKIKGKVGENLKVALAQLPISKQLATIKLDVEIETTLESLLRQEPDNTTLQALYKELEFKNWLAELLEKQPPANHNHPGYETIFTEEALELCLKKLNDAPLFAFDTETTHLNYMDAELVGVSFAVEPGIAAYVPFGHDYEGAPQQLSQEYVLSKLKPILENSTPKIIGHNIKYDFEVLAKHGIHLQALAFDSMLESYILESANNRHDMDSLALKHLGLRTITYEDVAGKGAKQIPFNKVNIKEAAHYAAEDADVTLQLHQKLWPRLSAEAGLKTVYTTLEQPLISVLARMELNGVCIDPHMLTQQTFELEQRLNEIEVDIFQLTGRQFNINSPKQLQEILFQQLNLPIISKTPTGQASTADSVLQELALEYDIPRLIIEYRSLSKLITTYTKKLPEQIDARTQRIHTSYNQTGAATGRLSSSDPNLQNIPIRTAEGRRIRQAFIAPPGYQLICADYSQIELRIMAQISNDPNLLYAFENDLDIHTATAAEILGIPLESVSANDRRNAKAINFGLIYGMSAFGLAKQIGSDRHEAQRYIERYFARYPNVRTYMDTTRGEARTNGFVQTLTGRRLYLPEIHSSQIPRQKAAERTAINAPLQGTAADIIKKAMISLDTWLCEHPEVDAKMIMQVHDELVFEVAEKDIELMTTVIREKMANAASLKVPLLVSIGVGNNWDSASK